MIEVLVVGLGGFLGSIARYTLTQMANRWPGALPFGTLVSNAAAGLLIGFIIGMERSSGLITPRAKLFLTTGLLGGLSTFSTFSLETVDIFNAGKPVLAICNMVFNLGLSMAGVVMGMGLSKIFIRQ